MPNINSAKKRMRSDKKREERNTKVKSELKTLKKKALISIGENKQEDAKLALKLYAKKLDMAASKGVIHKCTASRNKSRTTRLFSKTFSVSASA